MGLFREAISDDQDRADMAYISIGALTVAALASLIFIFTMRAIDYYNCKPVTTSAAGSEPVTSVIPCRYDPLPLGPSPHLPPSLLSARPSGRPRAGRRHARDSR